MDIIHFLFYLVISAVCAGIASRVVPVPGPRGKGASGFLPLAILGIVGAWLGEKLLGPVGPALEGVRLIPAIIGSLGCVFVLSLIGRIASFRMPGPGPANTGKKR